MPFIADYILDLALNEFDTAVCTLWLCNAEPTSYAQAANSPGSSGFSLGTKTPLVIPIAENRTPNGRKVVVATFSDGSVTFTGTASHWAITKLGTTLMATGALASTQAVTSGNTFSLPAFDIGIPDAV